METWTFTEKYSLCEIYKNPATSCVEFHVSAYLLDFFSPHLRQILLDAGTQH